MENSKYSISPNSGRLRKKVRIRENVPMYKRVGIDDFNIKRLIIFLIVFIIFVGILYTLIDIDDTTYIEMTKINTKAKK
jgi:hypothetical protein